MGVWKSPLEVLGVSPINALMQSVEGRKVFVTGHTGFKGTWLVHLLHRLGCEVTGYALAPETTPSMFALSGAERYLTRHHLADIRDGERLAEAVNAARPDLVLHLAAQPLVRGSYLDPVGTWDTNVMGTINLLEAVRQAGGVGAVVVVTTDKVYENHSQQRGYRESDTIGGHDPYSASKAASELAVRSYRQSYFSTGGPHIATGRGGNVIGGGDWSEDRLMADAARAVAGGKPLTIRNPQSTRPWQHVLDCISGYLMLGGALLYGQKKTSAAYNFGPPASDNLTVADLLDRLKPLWPGLDWHSKSSPAGGTAHEASLLYLDSSKALRELGWQGRWSLETTLAATATWYMVVAADPRRAAAITSQQLDEYLA